MRHIFVSHLVKELLGPREGATEVFPSSDEPRNEYSTGQLFPPLSSIARAPEEEECLAPSADDAEEDSADSPIPVNQAFIDAGQTFRRVPSSLGISFVLTRAPTDNDLAVCITWARYEEVPGVGWRRVPQYWIAPLSAQPPAQPTVSPDGSLQLAYRYSAVDNGNYKTSIYVTSVIVPARPDRRPQNDEIIFQPEIRVILTDEAILAELGETGFASHDHEWRRSTRQYDRLAVFARGHLCGAYWRDIDPQRPFANAPPSIDVPFRWVDGEFFIERDPRLRDFLVPTLRTDFMPMYPGPTPGLGGQSLSLRAEVLSRCSDAAALEAMLMPIVTAYEQWLTESETGVAAGSLDASILERHREAIRRIRAGVRFLSADQDAFLAFLFMQRAMAKQYAWGKPPSRQEMAWRPFQLAFILMCVESTARNTPEREICDTIWFPTGGGKTEAYLGLAAFALAYRRRTSQPDSDGSRSGEGTTVISRYTLRLLTIQQFRRALKMIAACEILRCSDRTNQSAGWVPHGLTRPSGFFWGRTPFSIGLWVGARVTPNAMKGEGFRDFAPGALPLLSRPAQGDESDPAQILDCPCCGAVLSFPFEGNAAGPRELRLHVAVVAGGPRTDLNACQQATTHKISVSGATYEPHPSGRTGYLTLSVTFNLDLGASDIHQWWQDAAEGSLGVRLNSFTAARPGYVRVEGGRQGKVSDYEIRCPRADCELNTLDFEHKLPGPNGQWQRVPAHPLFALPNQPTVSRGVRLSAITVDEKIYQTPPSLLIGTVDKFARLAFTNEAASIFGRVRSFDAGPNGGFSQEVVSRPARGKSPVGPFAPPSLIIQDELHLLEGPLGSVFGLFETAIGSLSERPKYIASSATVRNSVEQVACLMGRQSFVFPPVNTDIENGFFLQSAEVHPLNESRPGRLFLGMAFPGRAPQTPMLRTWGRLLQTAEDIRTEAAQMPADQREARLRDLDYFWTLVGYFNAVRELAQGETLVRQDIPQFLDKLHRQNPNYPKREHLLAGFRNLSSQTGSSELPGILAKMERTLIDGDALHAVAATSMFGTGVDVARLSLMVVHGQPKSASQYIQAVGRVGRERAGLATVFFRVTKPRDLNHYEFFTGYHRRLPVSVEPITVKPLSPKAIDRVVGALITILLRNWRAPQPQVPTGIDEEGGGNLVEQLTPQLIAAVLDVFGRKWDEQPPNRRPAGSRDRFLTEVRSHLERWQEYARRQRTSNLGLAYTKGTAVVVLSNSDGLPSVFPSAPQSLREVEPVVTIQTEND